MKLEYAQFEELKTFTRFVTRLDETTRKTIINGQRIRECLKQYELQQLAAADKILVLLSLKEGLFDTIPIDKIQQAEKALLENTKDLPGEIIERIKGNKKLSEDDSQEILKIAASIRHAFQEDASPDQAQK